MSLSIDPRNAPAPAPPSKIARRWNKWQVILLIGLLALVGLGLYVYTEFKAVEPETPKTSQLDCTTPTCDYLVESVSSFSMVTKRYTWKWENGRRKVVAIHVNVAFEGKDLTDDRYPPVTSQVQLEFEQAVEHELRLPSVDQVSLGLEFTAAK